MLESLLGLAASAGLALNGCKQGQAGAPLAGDSFPEFSLPDLQGRLHDSRSYAGRPLLLNFWATWCPPCRKEMADLERLHQALTPQGLVLLAISLDQDLNLVREFVRREQLTMPVLVDANQGWSRVALHMRELPSSYLVAADFRIKEVVTGARPWADATVQQALAGRLNLKI
jgi:peroxiredoxin